MGKMGLKVNFININNNKMKKQCKLENFGSLLPKFVKSVWRVCESVQRGVWKCVKLSKSLREYPGSLHTKFQSPGINIERFFQLSDGVSKWVNE